VIDGDPGIKDDLSFLEPRFGYRIELATDGETRWKRKEAAGRLQISYKALLYKMKENGLSEGR
jgi:DNA-binding NtrC family response regulator